jgi:hypothetical protein
MPFRVLTYMSAVRKRKKQKAIMVIKKCEGEKNY